MIKISITRDAPNPSYEEERKEFNENSKYGGLSNHNNRPAKSHAVSILEAQVTEEQFEAIRKEVIKNF